MKKIELLAPAKDCECGIAAVNAGADAVYIGANKFGARVKAGNSVAEIEKLVRYAHLYWVKVYLTLNTVLFDSEIPEALKLAHQMYEIGIDGLIIQDFGLLEGELPPIPLISSTQMHNNSPAKIDFLEKVGFKRAILARELNLAEIKEIRNQTNIELEVFVHGALCVCFSGQCYLSYAIGGRSGNRGECAQPCRRRYSLIDQNNNMIVKDKYLLSLKDLNLSASLEDLIDAGVNSFKIEGRLKDKSYVTNVVLHYRRKIDSILLNRNFGKASTGTVHSEFDSDLSKTFNRGYTNYFFNDRHSSPGSIDTPKMKGEFIGVIRTTKKNKFVLDQIPVLHKGDGICFLDITGKLCGTVINQVTEDIIEPQTMKGLKKGIKIYRNHDHSFLKKLNATKIDRKISVQFFLTEEPGKLVLEVLDEDQNSVRENLEIERKLADNPEIMRERIVTQLVKTGGTIFKVSGVSLKFEKEWFLSISQINAYRRIILKKLEAARGNARPRDEIVLVPNTYPYPQKELDFQANVTSQKAIEFFKRHGVLRILPGAETGLNLAGCKVMTMKYCIREELEMCHRKNQESGFTEPFFLIDENGHQFRIEFNCRKCEMNLYYE